MDGTTPVSGGGVAALLEALGQDGDGSDRRAALVALLGGSGDPAGSRGGAFAVASVTAPLTQGFQNCLREPAVNDGQPNTNARRSRKQC